MQEGGSKGIIDSQTAEGGWPELRSQPATADGDHNDRSNARKQKPGLALNNFGDRASDAIDNDYPKLEEYLNSLTPTQH